MSEEHAKYDAGGGSLPPGTLLKFTDDNYQEPTAEDVRTLRALSGLTGRELAELAGIADQRTFRRWTTPPGASGARQIPYAAWRLLLIETGMV